MSAAATKALPPRRRDLRLAGQIHVLLVLALTVLCGVLAASAPDGAARVASGLVLGLALPGYALSALVFGRERLTGAELLLCTLGTSLIVSALGGLLLDALPGHMGRAAWAMLLSLVTVLAALAAVLRPLERDAPRARAASRRGRGCLRRTILNACVATLALAGAVVAVAVARHAADRAPAFSELSVLPVSSGGDPRMLIRVNSHEHHAVSLRLTISEDGRRVSTTYRTLLPGEEWRLLTRHVHRRTHRLVVRLYRKSIAAPFLHTIYYPNRTRSGRSLPAAAETRAAP
jgi:hypothetical protein